MIAFVSRIVIGTLLAVAGTVAHASDTPSCRSYCSNGTWYTNGFKTCAGSDCWCDYTVVPGAPECPKPPEKPWPPRAGDDFITLQPGSQITLGPTTVVCAGAPGGAKCVCRYHPQPGQFSYELIAQAATGVPVLLDRYFDREACVQAMTQAPECK